MWARGVEYGAKVKGKGVGEEVGMGMGAFFKGLEKGRRRGFVDLRVSGLIDLFFEEGIRGEWANLSGRF